MTFRRVPAPRIDVDVLRRELELHTEFRPAAQLEAERERIRVRLVKAQTREAEGALPRGLGLSA